MIEGIHCLNDALSHSLPRESKFKIYISALTQLNIDEHNRIPTTDGRLLRRMVRDARTRGAKRSPHDPDVAFCTQGGRGKYFPVSGRGGRDVQFSADLRAFRTETVCRADSFWN